MNNSVCILKNSVAIDTLKSLKHNLLIKPDFYLIIRSLNEMK